MLTIVFSSQNGMGTLPRMIERLRAIDHPPGLRIVAIDNASVDGTGDFLRSCRDKLPLTVIDHPEGGSKNTALNFAIDSIAGQLRPRELVVFTDDDILPDDGWLLELSRAAVAVPDANVFGGVIRPVFPDQVPAWLPDLEGEFPVLFSNTTARQGFCTGHDIFGPNMAVRAEMFMRGLRFNAAIGPDGTKRFGMGSESELLRRLDRAGHRLYFCEHAIVEHQVKPSLLVWQAICSRAWRYGLGMGMMERQQRSTPAQWMFVWQRLLSAELKAMVVRLPGFAARRARLLFWREVQRGRLRSLFMSPLAPLDAASSAALDAAATAALTPVNREASARPAEATTAG